MQTVVKLEKSGQRGILEGQCHNCDAECGSGGLCSARAQESELKTSKDLDGLRKTADAIEQTRMKLNVIEGWSSVEVIRHWREHPGRARSVSTISVV